MATATSVQVDDPGRARLFEMATPDLYQVNPFRVLGLPVHASRADVRKREKRMRRKERLGLAASWKGGYLPLPALPNEDDVREAMQRLQDPVARLFDEFFWFWPQKPGNDDDALKLLGHKRTQDAHKLWLSRESSGTQDMVSTHNLAVLYHVSALDFEQRLAGQSLSDKDHQTRIGCWQRTFKRWHSLVNCDPFWARVRDRIRELDDPRLTSDLAHNIRDALSEVILLINARLAVQAAESKKPQLAAQHIQIMRKSHFDQAVVDTSLRECLRPIRHRLSCICGDAEPEADANPAAANLVTRRLLKEARPLLAIINMMLPEGDGMREGAHDEVAHVALRCQITYGNETEDWKESSAVYDVILKYLSPSTSMRTRIEENRDIVANNLRLSICYFCGKRQASDYFAVVCPMYGNVRRRRSGADTYRVTWDTIKVRVPRCLECKSHQERLVSARWTGFGVGALTGFSLWVFVFVLALWIFGVPGPSKLAALSDLGMFGILSSFALAPGLGGLIGAGIRFHSALSEIPYTMKGENDVGECELIRELQMLGWERGEAPFYTAEDE